jgi:hypothetical protein
MRTYGLLLAAVTTTALPFRIALADPVPLYRLTAAPAPGPAKAKAPPKRIPARERTADVVPQALARDRGDPMKTVTVVASEEQANAHADTKATTPMPAKTAVCFNDLGTKRALTLQMNERSGADAVQALHVERLSAGADTATLDTTEVFLDLRTLGSRAVSRTTMTLSKIAEGPDGMRVFAASQPDGRVQFVVTRAQPTQNTPLLLTSLVDASAAPVDREQSDCGYVHFTLSAKGSTAQMAEIFTPALASPELRDPDDESDPRAQADRRGRAISLVVSLSQLPSEAAPLLSVTFGRMQ